MPRISVDARTLAIAPATLPRLRATSWRSIAAPITT